jgi:hypothetical protein
MYVQGWVTRMGVLFSYWRLLDITTVVSLLMVIVWWGVTGARLHSIQEYIASVSDASRSTFVCKLDHICVVPSPLLSSPLRSSIVFTTYAGVAAGPTDIQNRIFDATTSFAAFKVAAVVTLIALTLRLFKYFQFQPRLAVMTEVFSRGMYMHVL